MEVTPDRLVRAKQCLMIAESSDSKREAYVQAAEEIAAAFKEDPGLTKPAVATAVGINHQKVGVLLKWRESGFVAQTPWLMDKNATKRAALSHARKVLRENPEAVIEEMADAVDNPRVKAALLSHPKLKKAWGEASLEEIITNDHSAPPREGRESSYQDPTEPPATPLSPWEPLWKQVVPGQREMHRRMHEGAWNLPPQTVRYTVEELEKLAEFFRILGETAKEYINR